MAGCAAPSEFLLGEPHPPGTEDCPRTSRRCWALKQTNGCFSTLWCFPCARMRNRQLILLRALCLPPCSFALSIADCSQDVGLQCLLPRNKKLQQDSGFSFQAATGSSKPWRSRVPALPQLSMSPLLGICFLVTCQRLATGLSPPRFCCFGFCLSWGTDAEEDEKRKKTLF